jgi:uncharacterized protein (UPF0332 family)
LNASQQALLAKARRSVAAGRRLATDGDLDFAVSRAYYAMFYTAQAFLLGRERRFSKHSAVIAAFGEEFAREDETLREFHHGIIEAQDARNVGDYQIDAALSREDVETHLDRAERFIRVAEQGL